MDSPSSPPLLRRAMAAAASWVPPTLPQSEVGDAAALLDMQCYIADRPNATTAKGFTSGNLPIQVTFHSARPPVLSHICVHCPDMDFPDSAPKVITTHADLVLLRVPINPDALFMDSVVCWDYFVYRADPPLLDLLPNPYPNIFNDSEAAVLSHGSGYVVATLRNMIPRRDPKTGGFVSNDFELHLYRSSSAEDGWIPKLLSVDEPLRDTLVPLPDAVADLKIFHVSAKTITIGGERGTIAWVDLWRGIILCDVLDECPVLHDLPLPPPAMGNWDCLFEEYCNPNLLRDVTVNRSKNMIKYVEMELDPPSEPDTSPDSSYLEWVRKNPTEFSTARRDGWKATSWSIPIVPFGSLKDWQRECEIYADEVTVAEPWRHSKLLGSGTEATLLDLAVSHPTMSLDDNDVVYLLSEADDTSEMVVAVDMREKMLCGLAELDKQKGYSLMPTYCCTEIASQLQKKSSATPGLKSIKEKEVESKATVDSAMERTRGRRLRKRHLWRHVPSVMPYSFRLFDAGQWTS